MMMKESDNVDDDDNIDNDDNVDHDHDTFVILL